MRIPRPQEIKSCLPVVAAVIALALLPGCSVSVKDKDSHGNSKVDINTPVGGIHVDDNADVRDTGLPVYPGARKKPTTGDGDKENANVNISTFGFGLKVVALEYVSDDSPDKLVAFYQDKLKRYGNVLQCRTSSSKVGDNGPAAGGRKGYVTVGKLKCDDDEHGNSVELKVGNDDNQHIVSVRPDGKGAEFSIVWVRVRGKEGDI